MITIQLAAVGFMPIAIVSTVGWVYTFRTLRRSKGESAVLSNELADLRGTNKQSEDELAVVKRELANTQGTLKRFRDFIEFLEPLFLELARDAGDGRARSKFWRKTALDFLAELKEQDAAEKTEAALDFAFATVDTAVSHVIPHPSPRRCL